MRTGGRSIIWMAEVQIWSSIVKMWKSSSVSSPVQSSSPVNIILPLLVIILLINKSVRIRELGAKTIVWLSYKGPGFQNYFFSIYTPVINIYRVCCLCVCFGSAKHFKGLPSCPRPNWKGCWNILLTKRQCQMIKY